MAGRRLHQHQYNLALMPFVMNKTTSITVFGKTRISFVLVFTLAMPTLKTTYGLEFTGERWSKNIRFHCIQDCPDYVLLSIEKTFESLSPILFEITAFDSQWSLTIKSLAIARQHPIKV
jgi:hypothetical protein